MDSVPVDSLGRTANVENKHSLWLEDCNSSLPNSTLFKKVVDAVSCVCMCACVYDGDGELGLKQNPK